MVHYLNQPQREKLKALKEKDGQVFPKHEHKLIAFINSAIYPYDWTQIYVSLRLGERISFSTLEAVKGVIMAMIVVSKRKNENSYKALDEYFISFIELVRSDRQGDPEKFLLNMRWYFPRFLFIVGLKVSFGIDWKELVVETLDLKKKPEPKTYGSLFLNKYLRSLLYSFIVYKNYREAGDDDYVYGKNDINTLLDFYALKKYAVSREVLQLLLVHLQLLLPSYTYSIRKQSGYAIDNALDGYSQINSPWYENSKKHNKVNTDARNNA